MMGVSHSHTGSDRRECCDLDVGPHVLSASPVTTHEVDQELGAGHKHSSLCKIGDPQVFTARTRGQLTAPMSRTSGQHVANRIDNRTRASGALLSGFICMVFIGSASSHIGEMWKLIGMVVVGVLAVLVARSTLRRGVQWDDQEVTISRLCRRVVVDRARCIGIRWDNSYRGRLVVVSDSGDECLTSILKPQPEWLYLKMNHSSNLESENAYQRLLAELGRAHSRRSYRRQVPD